MLRYDMSVSPRGTFCIYINQIKPDHYFLTFWKENTASGLLNCPDFRGKA